MAKTYISLLFIFFLFSCASKHNDLARDNIKGKARQLKRTTYKAIEKFGEVENGDLFLKQITVYNEQGNTIEESEYNFEGILNSRLKVTYDEEGNFVEANDYYADGSRRYKLLRKEDEQGNPTEFFIYSFPGSKLFSKQIIKFNSHGKMIQQTVEYVSSKQKQTTLFYYDAQGNRIKEEWLNQKKAFTFKYKGYDKAGNWEKRIAYQGDSAVQVVEERFEYYK